ncbi:MAG: hypothetical protein QM767_02945 [Anaeromyxobacter sp.]
MSAPTTSASAADAVGATGVLRRVDFENDVLGRVTRQVLPNRQDALDTSAYRVAVEQKYDRWGNMLSQSNPTASGTAPTLWTDYTYNAFNQVTSKTDPLATAGATTRSTTTIRYDVLGRQVEVKDARGYSTKQEWDAGGQLVKETRGIYNGVEYGGVVTRVYDAFGNQVRVIDALNHKTDYVFDRLNRNTRIVTESVKVYSADTDYKVTQVAEKQLETVMTYDAAGRKLSQTNGDGETTRYVYDLRGNIVETIQPMGQSTVSAWDAAGKQNRREGRQQCPCHLDLQRVRPARGAQGHRQRHLPVLLRQRQSAQAHDQQSRTEPRVHLRRRRPAGADRRQGPEPDHRVRLHGGREEDARAGHAV